MELAQAIGQTIPEYVIVIEDACILPDGAFNGWLNAPNDKVSDSTHSSRADIVPDQFALETLVVVYLNIMGSELVL